MVYSSPYYNGKTYNGKTTPGTFMRSAAASSVATYDLPAVRTAVAVWDSASSNRRWSSPHAPVTCWNDEPPRPTHSLLTESTSTKRSERIRFSDAPASSNFDDTCAITAASACVLDTFRYTPFLPARGDKRRKAKPVEH